jgi:ribosome-binding protein aMBF1 (putative translation factor)
MIAPEQSRAARAWLDWSQEDLAKKAQVSLSTIRDFEKGRRTPIKNNLDAIQLALEMAGVSLLYRGDVPLGVQVTQPAS